MQDSDCGLHSHCIIASHACECNVGYLSENLDQKNCFGLCDQRMYAVQQVSFIYFSLYHKLVAWPVFWMPGL